MRESRMKSLLKKNLL